MPRLRIQEGVDVDAFSVMREIRQPAVAREDYDEPEQVDPGRGVDPGKKQLEQGEA